MSNCDQKSSDGSWTCISSFFFFLAWMLTIAALVLFQCKLRIFLSHNCSLTSVHSSIHSLRNDSATRTQSLFCSYIAKLRLFKALVLIVCHTYRILLIFFGLHLYSALLICYVFRDWCVVRMWTDTSEGFCQIWDCYRGETAFYS